MAIRLYSDFLCKHGHFLLEIRVCSLCESGTIKKIPKYPVRSLCSIDLLNTGVSLPRSWKWIEDWYVLFCLRFIEVIY